MQSTLALSVPRRNRSRSRLHIALIDVIAGIQALNIWGRLGWRDTKRRYRRTLFGPFWSTVSLGLFVVSLGLLWANLWGQNVKTYLPYLTSGMLCWALFSAICTEGCASFVAQELLIKQLRISYTLLACATVWRNVIVFFHNIIIYVIVGLYAGVPVTWATLLVVPGLALLWLNMIWIATLLGAACTRYRDIQQLISNLLQISLFLTPIFWTPEQLKGRMAVLVNYNPLYHLIDIVRGPLLGNAPNLLEWIVVLGITVTGWAVTIVVMNKFRHRIAYWL